MEVYRITSEKWAGKLVASGYPARWNSQGSFVIYTAATRALACLENVVHRDTFLPRYLFLVTVIDVPDHIKIAEIKTKSLPGDWYKPGPAGYVICQETGDQWLAAKQTAVLKVPSAIIQNEYNFLLNPNHPDFGKIEVKSVEDFFFDERLGIRK